MVSTFSINPLGFGLVNATITSPMTSFVSRSIVSNVDSPLPIGANAVPNSITATNACNSVKFEETAGSKNPKHFCVNKNKKLWNQIPVCTCYSIQG
jgi:hypothetical protein